MLRRRLEGWLARWGCFGAFRFLRSGGQKETSGEMESSGARDTSGEMEEDERERDNESNNNNNNKKKL